jgi:hypothetical protein
MSELSIHELETQHGELLPEREALGVIISFANAGVIAQINQLAVANQAFTFASTNTAENVAAIVFG